MILFFSDTHLGIKTHSIKEPGGLVTAEQEARNALNAIYERAKQDDVDMVVFGGDMFHTPHPTTKNIAFLTQWIHRMDALGKPFYLITGNHDVSMHSNSMIFVHELELENIWLLDVDTNHGTTWGEWDVWFIPYLPFETSKDRNAPTYEALLRVVENCKNKSIIVAHVYDSDVKVGSESTMISRFTETIDFDYFKQKKVILLLGHAHRYQCYNKKNNMRVIYPGSLFYHDLADANQDKGYVLIEPDGGHIFEKIMGLREFVSYEIPENEDILGYFKGFRMPTNRVVFVTTISDKKVDETALGELLDTKGCKLENVRYKKAKNNKSSIEIQVDSIDPFKVLNTYLVDKLKKEDRWNLLSKISILGNEFLEKAGGVQDEV